jgi:hypothetical protein
MKLLLKIKNGTPPMRKAALRQITDKAREFGAGPLFNQILPLLMSPTLEDQERHLLVKVIDRILYKLDDLVRPYVHKVRCWYLYCIVFTERGRKHWPLCATTVSLVVAMRTKEIVSSPAAIISALYEAVH